MLDKLPIKKDYLLIVATIILLLVSYRFAFKNTMDVWQIHRQLNEKVALSNDVTYQPGYLERKNNNLDKIAALYKADTALFRSNTISMISSIAEEQNVKLTEVPIQDVSYHTDNFIMERMDFEGDYFSLVKVISQLQLINNIGVLRAETWKVMGSRSEDNRAKKLVLECFLEIKK